MLAIWATGVIWTGGELGRVGDGGVRGGPLGPEGLGCLGAARLHRCGATRGRPGEGRSIAFSFGVLEALTEVGEGYAALGVGF